MTRQTLDINDPRALETFIRNNTRRLTPPLVPEIALHLAEESLPIWHQTEVELGQINLPPPYWSFAWAGGQALARYLLDHPQECRGKAVVDIGTGSGLTAIAASMSGARSVLAADLDALALASCRLNAGENGLAFDVTGEDLLASPPGSADVILIGDLFYERRLAERVTAYIDAAKARGATVLIGDPQRSYFPRDRFTRVADYQVPVTRELEDSEIKSTTVWRA